MEDHSSNPSGFDDWLSGLDNEDLDAELNALFSGLQAKDPRPLITLQRERIEDIIDHILAEFEAAMGSRLHAPPTLRLLEGGLQPAHGETQQPHLR